MAMFARATNDLYESRRKTPRRNAENCIATIDGKAYPVHNWSDGGILVQADDRMFSVNSPVDMVMKFRLGGKIVDIAHRGRVLRKGRDRLAIEFEPITSDVSRKFRQVVDDLVANEFADSQIA